MPIVAAPLLKVTVLVLVGTEEVSEFVRRLLLLLLLVVSEPDPEPELEVLGKALGRGVCSVA